MKKILYEGKIFYSELEYIVYYILKKFYKIPDIKTQIRYTLTRFPSVLDHILDFETPHNYIEVKGGWLLSRQQELQYLKTKTYWFVNQYNKKKFLLVVNNKKIILPGIKTILVSDLEEYLYGQSICRKK
ncbi:MAG: hypothetical protein QXM92_01595 [Candidatus Anstonellales archaeon]